MNMKQKTFIAVSIILTISSLWLFSPWNAVLVYFTPLPETVQEQVDEAIAHGLDGIIVYVDQKGQVPKFYASGWKNRDDKTPSDPQALFKIASITKLYVAAAVAKLVNQQELSLDRTLEEYLPSLGGRIENAEQITLRMLVQHRSGIPNFTDAPNYSWSEPNDVLKLILDQPAKFKPGTRYSYSNTNYYLIGEIIEKTLGHDYQHYIKKEILGPLGLKHTYTSMDEINMAELMSGYTTEYDGDLKAMNFQGSAGSMVSTAEDVGIFLWALNDGSLFNDSEQAIYSSIYVYGHTGLLPGYSSIARYHKDIDAVVIQFVNTSGGNTWTMIDVIYNRIVRIMGKQESTFAN